MNSIVCSRWFFFLANICFADNALGGSGSEQNRSLDRIPQAKVEAESVTYYCSHLFLGILVIYMCIGGSYHHRISIGGRLASLDEA